LARTCTVGQRSFLAWRDTPEVARSLSRAADAIDALLAECPSHVGVVEEGWELVGLQRRLDAGEVLVVGDRGPVPVEFKQLTEKGEVLLQSLVGDDVEGVAGVLVPRSALRWNRDR